MEEKKTIKFADLLKEKTILILSILFIVGMSIVFLQMFNLAFKVKEKMTRENAALLIKSLEDFRTLYTSEVVVRVKPYGIEVTHDYLDKEGAIPLPATLSMMLGKLIGTDGVSAQVRLYSDYPFPWRLKERGPLDQQQREIIAQLRKSPDKPIVRLEETNGNKNHNKNNK